MNKLLLIIIIAFMLLIPTVHGLQKRNYINMNMTSKNITNIGTLFADNTSTLEVVDINDTLLDYSDVLIITNLASSDSIAISEYFMGKRNNVNQLNLTLVTTESTTNSTFFTTMMYPIQSYLNTNDPNNKIRYIVLTREEPLRVTSGITYVFSVSDALNLVRHNDTWGEIGTGSSYITSGVSIHTDLIVDGEFDYMMTTRLDGPNYAEVIKQIPDYPLIPITGRILIDGNPNKASGYRETPMYDASVIFENAGYDVIYDNTTTFLTDYDNLSGYMSNGANDGNEPSNNGSTWNLYFNPGSFSTTFVSTTARTFREPFTYGQDLLTDQLMHNATMAMGTTDEPTTLNLVYPEDFARALVSGYTYIESYYNGLPRLGHRGVVVGDPKIRIVYNQTSAKSNNPLFTITNNNGQTTEDILILSETGNLSTRVGTFENVNANEVISTSIIYAGAEISDTFYIPGESLPSLDITNYSWDGGALIDVNVYGYHINPDAWKVLSSLEYSDSGTSSFGIVDVGTHISKYNSLIPNLVGTYIASMNDVEDDFDYMNYELSEYGEFFNYTGLLSRDNRTIIAQYNKIVANASIAIATKNEIYGPHPYGYKSKSINAYGSFNNLSYGETCYGVYSTVDGCDSGYAGWFDGNVTITGNRVCVGAYCDDDVLDVTSEFGNDAGSTCVRVYQEDDGSGHAGGELKLCSYGWGSSSLILGNNVITPVGGYIKVQDDTNNGFLIEEKSTGYDRFLVGENLTTVISTGDSALRVTGTTNNKNHSVELREAADSSGYGFDLVYVGDSNKLILESVRNEFGPGNETTTIFEVDRDDTRNTTYRVPVVFSTKVYLDGYVYGGPEFVGNVQFQDAESATKAYRFRSSGGALDFDVGGADMYFSTYPNADFTGTQNHIMKLDASSQLLDGVGEWKWHSGTGNAYGNPTVFEIDGNDKVDSNLEIDMNTNNITNVDIIYARKLETSGTAGDTFISLTAGGKIGEIFPRIAGRITSRPDSTVTTNFYELLNNGNDFVFENQALGNVRFRAWDAPLVFETLNGDYDISFEHNGIGKMSVTTNGLEMSDDIDMNNKNITDVDCITFNSGGQICTSS